jgi:hypothetical protein
MVRIVQKTNLSLHVTYRRESERCGLQFAHNFSSSNASSSLRSKKSLEGPIIRNPERHRAPISTLRETAKTNLSILIVLIKALVSLRRLALRLRKQEENELSHFRIVHIKKSPPRSDTTAIEDGDHTHFSALREITPNVPSLSEAFHMWSEPDVTPSAPQHGEVNRSEDVADLYCHVLGCPRGGKPFANRASLR